MTCRPRTRTRLTELSDTQTDPQDGAAPAEPAAPTETQASAPAADGAVVDHGAQLAGHLLPQTPAEGRHALAVEIGFEAVSHGFVQQNARPAGPQHHRHFAGRRLHRIQHDHGLARGFGGEELGGLLFEEKVERDAPAPAGLPALRLAAILPRQRRQGVIRIGLFSRRIRRNVAMR